MTQPPTFPQPEHWRAKRDRERREAEDALVAKVMICVWPGCTRRPMPQEDRKRPTPLCSQHAWRAWAEYFEGVDLVTYMSQTEKERSREAQTHLRRIEQRKVKAKSNGGQVYYIRLNGVIKVGWTADLARRIREYSFGAELLAHHDGTRDDEQALHQTFKPYRLHGREWYQGDAPMLLRHIEQVLAEHGPPRFKVKGLPKTG